MSYQCDVCHTVHDGWIRIDGEKLCTGCYEDYLDVSRMHWCILGKWKPAGKLLEWMRDNARRAA